tara:strand:- start:387 stop:1373 length:987 start_codon:yes stop_codon:yes gene_type:complete
MKRKLNVALIGSNFALKGYLPVIKKIKQLDLKTICSRNILKIKNKINYSKTLNFENNWKKVFKKKIDLIICSVPPIIQEKILIYNLNYKKKIIFEKPISTKYLKSKLITKKILRKKIPSQINLIFLNHPLFVKAKNLIYKKKLGKVQNYKIKWSFVSQDFNKRLKSWKTDETKGGGIKNIFLTHILSYCEYLFGKNKLTNFKVSKVNFKNLEYKNKIYCELENLNSIKGKINIFTKKIGLQNHYIKIIFEKGYLELSTISKDWTKNFKLKIYNKIKNKVSYERLSNKQKYLDGRSNQIHLLFAKFLKKSNYSHIIYCLNAEKIINKIN